MKTHAAQSSVSDKPSANTAWLGLDVHAKTCVLAWTDNDGLRRSHRRFATSERQLIKALHDIEATDKRLALEEGGMSRWLAEIAAPHVREVTVCDPRENRSISGHHHKCDEEDAYRLGHLHRLGALKKVWQPVSPSRAIFKCVAQGYLKAVERQASLKCQLKALCRQWGLIVQGSVIYTAQGRRRCLEQIAQPEVVAQLRLLYDLLDSEVEGESQARRQMVALGKEFAEIQWLRTVPGVGVIGAHVFVAYIQDPQRFETRQQLMRYCRLGIRDRSSDGKPLGYQKLDPSGHGELKAISYRAWLAAMRKRSGAVHDFYQASCRRTGNKVHGRLNTQRKILETMWLQWKNQEEFDADKFLGKDAQPACQATCS